MPFPNIGPGELILILIIALVVLGPGKLPDVAQSLGKSVREFRKAATDITEAGKIDVPPPSEQATPPPAALAVPAPEPMPAAVATPPAADPVVTPAATAEGDPATAVGDTRDSNLS